jgi:hypothetical protein
MVIEEKQKKKLEIYHDDSAKNGPFNLQLQTIEKFEPFGSKLFFLSLI